MYLTTLSTIATIRIKKILYDICDDMGVINNESDEDIDSLEKLVNNENITMVSNLPDDYVYGGFLYLRNEKVVRDKVKLDVHGDLDKLRKLINYKN